MAELSSYPAVTTLAGTERIPVVTTPGIAGGNKYITAENFASATPFNGVSLPASNGSDDTTAINTILAARTGLIRGRPGQNYKVSTLTIYSNTTLDMTGCTITQLAVQANILVNSTVGTGSRNTNIKVIGGYWDRGANDVPGPANGAVGSAVGSHSLYFDGVDNLEVAWMEGYSTLGKYFIAPADCTNVHIHHISGTVHSAMVQACGPLDNIHIEHIRGTCGDDMVAIGSNDGTNFQALNWTHGPCTNIRINDISGTVTAGVFVKLFGDTDLVSSAVIENISGTVGGTSGVVIGAIDVSDNTLASITVRGVRVTGSVTAPVYVRNCTVTESLNISDVVNLNTATSTPAVWLQAISTNTVIDNVINNDLTHDVIVTDGTYGKITVRNCRNLRSNAYCIVACFTTSVDPTVDMFVVENCRRDSVGYTGYLANFESTTRRAFVINCVAQRTANAIRIGSASGLYADLHVSASAFEGVNWATFTGPGTISLFVDGDIAGDAARSASPILRCYGGLACSIDVSWLTPSNGQLANNTNAGLGCGPGPCVSDGTLWKNLYTGATT